MQRNAAVRSQGAGRQETEEAGRVQARGQPFHLLRLQAAIHQSAIVTVGAGCVHAVNKVIVRVDEVASGVHAQRSYCNDTQQNQGKCPGETPAQSAAQSHGCDGCSEGPGPQSI